MRCKVLNLCMVILLLFTVVLTGCAPEAPSTPAPTTSALSATPSYEYTGQNYIALNGNIPEFTQDQYTVSSYETYGDLDDLGRCTQAIACIGLDLMPTEDRGSIGQVKPSGWQTIRYDIVDGGYLYNRCHLIGFQLSGENANVKNLITGTRHMNTKGMLPFENMVADYVKDTENHVLYRVTPVFEGTELVARGVQIEALSMEDGGAGVCFNVYVYNIQPGITIDYATGGSRLSGTVVTPTPAAPTGDVVFILNTNSGKFHLPSCGSAATIKEENRLEIKGQTREQMIGHGYSACKSCNP